MKGLAGFEQMRSLARIDHDHAFRMVDDPRVRREPSGPVSVGEDPEPSSQSASPPLDLRGLDPDRAGLNGMQLHALTAIDSFTTAAGVRALCSPNTCTGTSNRWSSTLPYSLR